MVVEISDIRTFLKMGAIDAARAPIDQETKNVLAPLKFLTTTLLGMLYVILTLCRYYLFILFSFKILIYVGKYIFPIFFPIFNANFHYKDLDVILKIRE